MKKLVSIVIPAFNEEENIPIVCKSIARTFENLCYDYELIFIADGCTDRTMTVLDCLTAANEQIYYIEFSRNFGHQLALKAGLEHASGDCAISMDCDMQHPCDLIPELLSKWEEGYEVVYTLRKEDKQLPFRKRVSSRLYYKFLNTLSSVELECGTADFRLIDRKVIEAFKDFQETEPFLRGLFKWIGFKQFALTYHPAQRFAGQSKYNLKKMLSLALEGVTSFSTKPLYLAVYLGFAFSFCSILYLPYILHSLYIGSDVSGWASLITTVVFFGGLQLIILGIIGIYIGKMFMQGKNRPSYIIRSTNIQ